MIKSIVGCKSVERILFYLLLHDKCYAHLLHRILNIPLSPIQKGLSRLEKGEIIIGFIEGKTRVYQFNPNYPLLNELQMLLKMGFHHLPLQEKKSYYYSQSTTSENTKENRELLHVIWRQLKQVNRVSWIAKSKSKKPYGWDGKGNGDVVMQSSENHIIFHEQGSWQGEDKTLHQYSNSFRWTLSRAKGLLSLEHLRLGKDNPVFLFHLTKARGNFLESMHPHICKEDAYFGRLEYNDLFLKLHFRTIGPKKNEEIEYIYL
ncbi:MAG: winged helix-turn-helix transcriptional regulator [Chlamydiales bacterium]|nr:winged helix-turn-helix transcriptional regulator [Chlamydiales bacterium]